MVRHMIRSYVIVVDVMIRLIIRRIYSAVRLCQEFVIARINSQD